MTTITGLDELKRYEGKDLGTSDWHEVTQKDIDQFADLTGDHQWIHVDTEKAAAGRSGRPSPTGSSPSACCRC
jgi:acyl dehydratase